MKKIWLPLFLFILTVSYCRAQTNTLDIPLMHQLIDNSKSEHSLQETARTKQATVTATEAANKTQLEKLKNVYRTLQERYNSLGTAIDVAQIGIEATPLVQQIIKSQSGIYSLAMNNPALLFIATRTEIEFVEKSQSLVRYIVGLSLSIGDVNQMKQSDRKLLFDYIIVQLNTIAALSSALYNAIQYSTLKSILQSLNPVQDYINQDKSMVNDIISNAKALKQ